MERVENIKDLGVMVYKILDYGPRSTLRKKYSTLSIHIVCGIIMRTCTLQDWKPVIKTEYYCAMWSPDKDMGINQGKEHSETFYKQEWRVWNIWTTKK